MRFLLVAALALATCGGAVESRADGYVRAYKYKKQVHYYKKRVYSYRGRRGAYFPFGVGGHRFGYQHTPFLYRFQLPNQLANYHCTPVCNDQTFWERVETQGQYPVRY
jgi:hypothetical protein